MRWAYVQRDGKANSADELWIQRERNILALKIQVLQIDRRKFKPDMSTVTLPADSTLQSPFDDARRIHFRKPTRMTIDDITGLLARDDSQPGPPTVRPWRGRLILSSAVIVGGTLVLVRIFCIWFRQGHCGIDYFSFRRAAAGC